VAKVKNLLTGQPPTDEELKAVSADPKALAPLIDKWMAQPEFQQKSLAFFQNAFQQGQITLEELNDQLPERFFAGGTLAPRMLLSIKESFPRTVWQLSAEGRPLHEAVTTRRFLLNPPLMALLAYLDVTPVDDKGTRTSRLPNFAASLTTAQVPLAQTLDPKSPNYLKWHNPNPLPAECKKEPFPLARPHELFTFLFGAIRLPNPCPNFLRGQGVFTDADFDAWRMITIRAPKAGEATTPFYDVEALRKTNELVLRVPRIGFFSTPAFFANWATNESNEARVTINQTLIVALGKSFDDTNSTTPVSEGTLDKEHAGPTTPCYSCHRTLDPMRQFFRQAYTIYYHDQTDARQAATHGVFAFDGVSVQGRGIADLASELARHPRFGRAWAQKLCTYANSSPCTEDDPEFLRVVSAFAASGFRFKTLVRELFSSPIVTAARETKTAAERGVVVSISRRDHLCTALSERLGVADICGVSGAPVLTPGQRQAEALAGDLPADGYSRGAEAPLLSNDPSLFFRGATENLCRVLSEQVVDKPGMRYSSMKVDEAIADLTHNLMALPPADPRAAEVKGVLRAHFDAAKKGGATDGNALKSTFILACEAPSSIGIGL
jgi:hypothetical protein